MSQIIFDEFAVDDRISAAGFKQLCARKEYEDLTEEEIDAAFVRLDTDCSGYLEYDEFLQWWKVQDQCHGDRQDELRFRSEEEKKKVHTACVSFLRGTGGEETMTPEQFRLKCYIAGYCLSDEELEDAFKHLDKENTGGVSFVDYLRWRKDDDRFAHLQHHDDESAYFRQVIEFFRQYDTELKGYLDINQFSELYTSIVEAGWLTVPVENALRELGVMDGHVVKLNEFVRWYCHAVCGDAEGGYEAEQEYDENDDEGGHEAEQESDEKPTLLQDFIS